MSDDDTLAFESSLTPIPTKRGLIGAKDLRVQDATFYTTPMIDTSNQVAVSERRNPLMMNYGVQPTESPHRILISSNGFQSLLDSVALKGDLDQHFSFSDMRTTIPSLGEVCIDCTVPMRRSLPSISNDGYIYQGQIDSACKVRDLTGATLAKADIAFDFGLAPRILSNNEGQSILTADLTYLIAKSADIQPQVSSRISERLQSSRVLMGIDANQLVNSRFLDIINDATKMNLNAISDQIIPSGFKLPLPDWVHLNQGQVRLLSDGQVEISGKLSFE